MASTFLNQPNCIFSFIVNSILLSFGIRFFVYIYNIVKHLEMSFQFIILAIHVMGFFLSSEYTKLQHLCNVVVLANVSIN